ncbi:MAG: Tat pathway signal protein [Methylophaga sp.]|uniref:PhoX family protein n=1 Tax=Methylophaga sp. UBA678 TaxID=1946901 RepID=UPI000C529646|nr:PhoX family phosphatase [Methylophaga sp. UBA678]MAX50499.1 Tat pathway signal protein [Methylophaga sp.]|tara:strand:+ start:170412 stop:172388 length:1977 start_codon:yes stop_codon:yes gene_type:complete
MTHPTSSDFHQRLASYDDEVINHSEEKSLNSIAMSRRDVLRGSLNAAALGFLGLNLSSRLAFAGDHAHPPVPYIGFQAIQPRTDALFDQVVVSEGYQAKAFFSWGDPVETGATKWKADASNTWQEQLKQAGDNHDGMHFFAFPNDNNRGLMVINHEYINPTLHQNGLSYDVQDKRLLDDVKKEQAAHGVSVIEVKKDSLGEWQRVYPSLYNRRISTLTPMKVSGPLAGHALFKTASDPSAMEIIGTLNNCSNGFTPWGTYLACEENWHNYFVNHDKKDYQSRVSHKRYGISTGKEDNYYGWSTIDARFDATPNDALPHQGYVNEPNRFGWVVEIDPFDPQSKPVKRTAFGRFCRECVAPAMADNGQLAFYSGDDTRGEYVYKFVPSQRFDKADMHKNRDLLDEGTLYVGRFNDDGTGRWLPLIHGNEGLTAENGFLSQAEVLVNARAAADILGATPMDRPEWATVNPHNLDVYISLTNNYKRGKAFEINAANPRPDNRHGQIIKIMEDQADPAATAFNWSLFVLAGEKPGSTDANGNKIPDHLVGNIQGDIFSSPDGLGFDRDGRLWIMTDYDDDDPVMANMGCNQVLCANPQTQEIKRFLVGPRGCELTGITWSPDYKAMWVNIQHPGISYPASDGQTRPRSTTVLITKNDGGVIGT